MIGGKIVDEKIRKNTVSACKRALKHFREAWKKRC